MLVFHTGMFNNIIANAHKKLVYARNIGRGNSCPVECEYSAQLTDLEETRGTALPELH